MNTLLAQVLVLVVGLLGLAARLVGGDPLGIRSPARWRQRRKDYTSLRDLERPF